MIELNLHKVDKLINAWIWINFCEIKRSRTLSVI
jgi:hypothetical protein